MNPAGGSGGSTTRLEGRVALITGGTGGIGAATARRFVGEGAWVVVSGRSQQRGAELVRELGDHVRFVVADVTREEEVDSMIDSAVEWRGRLDIVFNNGLRRDRGDGQNGNRYDQQTNEHDTLLHGTPSNE